MTRAVIRTSPDSVDIKVRGHAGSCKNGADPVCAAASMLVCALMERLERMRGELCELHICYSSGVCEISARGDERSFPSVCEAVEVVACGFELLANSFPRSVAVRRVDGESHGEATE